ncbi:unnamed protein product, partial [Pocillopora meandrina]
MGEELEIKIWDYRKLKIRKTLGRGSFGTVYLANCVEPDVTNHVVMKVMHNSVAMRDDSRRLFIKEALLLKSLNHENIVRIYGICINPFTIIMEYVVFDFEPFQRNRKVSTLDEFLSEIARVPQSEEHRFDHLIPKIAVDITRGVAHLHGHEIVHRDLKPINILISNQHYSNLQDRRQLKRIQAERPIVCKLADFGESRSQWLQTNGLSDPNASQVFRGTIAFMAPEILLREPMVQRNKLTMDDLKKVDIWALGMVFYCLINPADSYPYERDGFNQPLDIMNFQKQRKRPSCDPKYENKQSSAWKHVKDVFHACTNHDPLRRPKATQIYAMLDASAASVAHSSLTTNVVPLKQGLSSASQGTFQWYASTQGESDVQYILRKLNAIADSVVDMSRNKDSRDLCMSFQCNGKQWQVRFPSNFPASNASLHVDGVFYAMVGGNAINTSVRALISTVIQPKGTLIHGGAAQQWYAGDQGEAALRYVSQELRNITDSELRISREKDTHDVTLTLECKGQHWEIRFPSNFPKSNASLFKGGDFYAMAGGDQLETAVREIINRIKFFDQPFPEMCGNSTSVTTEQWYTGESGEAALRYVFDALRKIADGEVKMRRSTDTRDITLSLRRRGRECTITFPYNFPKSNASVSTNREDYIMIGGNNVENAVSALINHITSVD